MRSTRQYEYDDLPDAPVGEIDNLETEIDRLRPRKQALEVEVNEFQSIIQLNEEILDDADHEVLAALEEADAAAGAEDGGSVTDQLVADDTVQCCTRGSTVEEDQIAATVETLRDLSQEKLQDVRAIEDDLDEDVPVMLLASLEAIDAERIATLVAYLEDYSVYLVVALLSKDAVALDDIYQRVTEI